MKAALTFAEAAHYLGIRERTLEELVKHGTIYFRRTGKTLLFLKTELDVWLKELPGVRKNGLPKPRDVFCDTTTGVSGDDVPHIVPSAPLIPLEKPPPRLDFQRKPSAGAR